MNSILRFCFEKRLTRRWAIFLAAGVALGFTAAWTDLDQGFDGSPDHPAIGYATRPAEDPIAQLNRKIQAGIVQLKFEAGPGYLRSVLRALNIPVESQLAVFSKTSVQARLIHPGNPRTLFFNDSVVIGWVRGGFIEAASQDPQQGVIFYTLAQYPTNYLDPAAKAPSKPMFEREDRCLSCHVSYASYSVPGMLLRSVFPASDGTPERELGDYIPDQRTPLEQRWGGWYVTGETGSIKHMGNAIVTNPEASAPLNASQKLNLKSLEQQFDTNAYLSPYSDVVALLVFEHQTHIMNLLTRAGWEFRYGEYEEKHSLIHSPSGGSLAARIREATAELVDYMLFVDEASLASRIRGTSGFAEKFAAQGPRDSQGRSLRQFDLTHRLMRYPCSYMIYSRAFNALPTQVKDATYARMWQILSGQLRDGKYNRLSLPDRNAIIEILRETKTDLPDYFQAVTK